MSKKLDYLLKFWIYSLTFSAGFLNVSAFLYYAHVVTHHTGSLTQLAINIEQGNFAACIVYFGLIICYVLGGTLSGYLFPTEKFHPKKRYSGILIFLSIGLLLVKQLSSYHHLIVWYLAFMMGTQNGMFVFYQGMIIRTTHMSGTLTDIGLAIGRWIKGHKEKYRLKLFLHLCNLLAFSLGCFFASYLNHHVKLDLIYLTIVFDFLLGLLYFYLYHRLQNNELNVKYKS